MKKTKVLTVMVCATMLTASGSAMAAYAEEASAPAFGFNQGGAPGEQMDFMGGQMSSGMPGGQMNMDGQTPPSMPDFSGENNAQMPPAFNNDQGGFMGGQNPPMGQPAEDDSRVIAKVTGIDGSTLTVEKLTPGEAGQQSSETVTYDISGITVGEDIKKDSMIEITLGEDGNVSSVSAGRNMPTGGSVPSMQMLSNISTSQVIEYFD